jgi:DNA invertase Pin-like site-specific DNA recombinase
MKALIYYRKSTDRDDLQQNSLEHQLTNCRNTAKGLWCEIIKEIWESASAKDEFKRAWFNEMIDICKKWKVSYIIIDEPKRLSRNNIDTSRVIDLMDKKQIKGIYASSRQYHTENARDKFLLQLDLSLSKMDNEDRSKDVRDKMLSCARNGKCLTKAPFGYKNITIRKWEKAVIVDEFLREVILSIFNMRKGGKSYKDISIYHKEKYAFASDFNIAHVQKIITNKFYYGIMTFSGQEFPWNHERIISKSLYDEANSVWVGKYEKKIENKDKFALKSFIRDYRWNPMWAYITKNKVYYKTQSYHTDSPINISEVKILDQFWEWLKDLVLNMKDFKELHRDIILDILSEKKHLMEIQLKEVEKNIEKLKNRKSELLDLRLDGNIEDSLYKEKMNQIEESLWSLEESKKKIDYKPKQIESLLDKIIELPETLYERYKVGDSLQRWAIMRILIIELSIGNKKELVVKENKPFQTIKSLKFDDGSATENWTPVPGMRIPCPSH